MTPLNHANTLLSELCCGCDAELGPDRYCANCEAVTETYAFDLSQPGLHEGLDAKIRRRLPARRKAA